MKSWFGSYGNPQVCPPNVWNEGAAFTDEVEDRVMYGNVAAWLVNVSLT